VANCADPAYTNNVTANAPGMVIPAFTMATPVTKPHTPMASDSGAIDRTPSSKYSRGQ
jgi:hypothetical protein